MPTTDDGANSSPTDPDVPDRRAFVRGADPVDYRQPDEEDGVFEVRLPIATTGEVRNQGDDPLTREELSGMARQIENRTVGVFLDHGGTDLGGMERYAAVEKVGEWTEADVREREADDTDELVATARLMDPETLPSATGQLREHLAAVKEQVERDFSLSSSIGWREDDAYPGGVDLMEASIVGIGADPRTTSDAAPGVVARAAVAAGADPDRLVAQVRASISGQEQSDRELTPEQATLARQVLADFRESQGDASLQDFSEWVYQSDDELDPDEQVAARSAIDEYVRTTTPWEDPLSETLDPFLSDGDSDDEQSHDMTDTDDGTTEEQDADADGADGEQTDADTDESREAPAWADRMLDLLEDTNDTIQTVADAVREDDEDGDDEDGDGDTDEEQEGDGDDEEDEDDEQAADTDEADDGTADGAAEQDADVQALADEVAELRSELAEVREGGLTGDDVDTPDDGESRDADEDEENRDADDTSDTGDDADDGVERDDELREKYGFTPN